MRSLILIYFAAITLMLCMSNNYVFAQEGEPYPLSVEIKVINEYRQPFTGKVPTDAFVPKDTIPKARMYDIAITIKNISTKQVFFWTMNCSWQDNFLVNNDYMKLLPSICYKNNPYCIALKSNDSVVMTGTLMMSLKFDYPCKYCQFGKQVEATKLGLIVANDIYNSSAGDFDSYILSMTDKSKWKIVWGNPVYLLK